MGTVTGPPGPLSNPDYPAINASAERAYRNQTGQPTGVNGDTFPHLLARAKKWVKNLNPNYKLPTGTTKNEAILLYLHEAVRCFEVNTQPYPGEPDAGILGVMANDNHQSCILFLDSILHALCDKNTIGFPPNYRPKFTAGQGEDYYFVGYLDAIGQAHK